MTGFRKMAAVSLAVASAMAVGRTGRAQTAVAEVRFDVDRDGVSDIIRIADPPAVSVVLGRGDRPVPDGAQPDAWKPFLTALDGAQYRVAGGRISAAAGKNLGGRTVIVAIVELARKSSQQPSPQPSSDPHGRGSRAGLLVAEEAMVVEWHKGALASLWSGAVGRQGRDGDYRIEVEATSRGLLRYQTRRDITRCDGKPVALFPERYDFAGKRFRSVYSEPRMPAAAPVLVAQTSGPPGGRTSGPSSGDGADVPAAVFRARAASAQAGAVHAGDLTVPREIDDGDLGTAWREDLGGNGRGELITFTTGMATPEIVALRIIPGHAASADLFRRVNRLRRIGLLVGKKHAFWIEFARDPVSRARADRSGGQSHRQPYWVTLPAGIRGNCVTVIIDQTYPGRAALSPRAGDTAVSELAILTDIDLAPGGAEAVLAARVAAGGDAGRVAERLLRGPRAITALLAEAQKPDHGAAKLRRLRVMLARLALQPGSPPDVEQLTEQLAEGLADDQLVTQDRQMIAAALVDLGRDSVAAMAALLADEDERSSARQRAARVLAAIAGPAALAALIAACGRGDRALRRAVSLGLSRRGLSRPGGGETAALMAAVAAARQAGEVGREGDLWRAIGLLARRLPVNIELGRAMIARLGTAREYELRARLFAAAAAAGDDATLAALARATLATAGVTVGVTVEPGAKSQPLRRQSEGNALRRIVATALAANSRPAARSLLIDLAADRDPGVRHRAVSAIGQRDDADGVTDRAVTGVLAGDRWPRIRRAAAAALARRCKGPGMASSALQGAVASDSDIEVRRVALTSLVDCRSPNIGRRLIAVATDRDQPSAVRERAITLLAVLGDISLTGEVSGLFTALSSEAWARRKAVRLAAAAAVSLGRLGRLPGPDGKPLWRGPARQKVLAPLLAAAREDSFPAIQAAAVTGLGEMCPPEAMAIFAALLSSSQAAVAVAARGAHSRCRASRR